MAVARISILQALEGRREELEKLLDELEEHLSKLPGYVMGFRFEGHADRDNIGRIGIWKSRDDANHAAILTHTENLREKIGELVQPGHLEELADIVGTPINLPNPD